MATNISKRGGKVKTGARRIRKPKPKHTQMLPVRISADLLNRVDDIKPSYVAREPFIRHLLDIGIRTIEAEEKAA